MTFKKYLKTHLPEEMRKQPYKRRRIRKKKAKVSLRKAWEYRQRTIADVHAELTAGLQTAIQNAMRQIPRRGYPMRLAYKH